MENRNRVIRMGLTVLAWAAVLMVLQPLARVVSRPEVASFLIYLETGQVVKMELLPPQQTQPPATEATQPAQSQLLFREEDAREVEIQYFWDCAVDAQAMLLSDLRWDLTQWGPRVLIVHSHATESYTQTGQDTYTPSAPYRTLDTDHNMVRVGAELKTALEALGIGVIHDTTLHDYPAYNDSYIRSRESVEVLLEKYPSICLVLDLHRDAVELDQGKQLSTRTDVGGTPGTQLMLVVGSNAGGRVHPDWEENMALAVKLHTQLEKRYPGLCRPISVRTERFNQDLSPGALLVEVGAAGDTLEDALVSVRALAQAIGDLALGAGAADSTS